MSIRIDEVLEWRGHDVVDRNGDKVGVFDEIYLDEKTNEPAWAAVKMGPLRLRRRVVPIEAAESDGAAIRLPFTKDQVKSAPAIDSDGWVPEHDQAAILRHYGLSRQAEPTTDPAVADTPDRGDQPEGLRLKRYTVTETLTRRSEFGPD